MTEPLELLALFLAAAGTAWLSAVAGIGGGLVLLVILLQFMEPTDAIPVHGAIQVASNATRAWALRPFVKWGIVVRHGLLLVPGGLVGLEVAQSLPRRAARALIGVFALVATWRPGLLAPRLGQGFPERGFLVLGAIHGAINMPLGATGPMIAPFFRAALDDRRTVVGTLAAAQVTGHLVKVVLFGLAGFAFGDFAVAVGVGAVGVSVGTLVGTRALERVSERVFAWLFRGAVTLVAVPLVLGIA